MVAVLLLALGIGANTAIFSALYGVLLKGLPYSEPERLAMVWEYYPGMPDPPGARIQATRANFESWQKRSHSFLSMGAWHEEGGTETGLPAAEHRTVGWVTPSMFSTFGAQPRLGRVFREDENIPGKDNAIVLSEGFWERRFGRDANCLGRNVALDGKTYTVIGVMPERFKLPALWGGSEESKAEVWIPLSNRWSVMARRGPEAIYARELNVLGRLRPGVSLEQARKEMTALAADRQKEDPEHNSQWSTNVQALTVESRPVEAATALWVLSAAVGFVLLIACANLASVLLARAARRKRDVAIRIALGASRMRIVRQFLLECTLLATAGGTFGLLLAYWLIEAVRKFYADLPYQQSIRLQPEVFLFALAISLLSGALFGILPALMAARRDVQEDLKASGGRGSTGTFRTNRLLVAGEVALALVLATGAGLMLKSFWVIATMDQGYQPDRILAFDLNLSEQRYKSEIAQADFNRRLVERLEAIPGVVRAAVSDTLPLHRISAMNVVVEGVPKPPNGSQPILDYGNVSPGYFSTMGMRLKAGRWFTDRDLTKTATGAEGLAMVNEAAAKKLWGQMDVVGKRLKSADEKRGYTIIGIIADNHQFGPEAAPRPQVYYPFTGYRGVIAVVRSAGDPQLLAGAIRNEVHLLDNEQPVEELRTLAARLDEWLIGRRFQTVLLAVFAGLAVLLAAIGIYGVLAQVVAARTQEIGIRMALGAQRSDVLRLMLRQSMTTVGIGILVGLAGTLMLSRFVESLLFRVQPRDPATIAGLTLVILAVAVAATVAPAYRATRIDPTVALREE